MPFLVISPITSGWDSASVALLAAAGLLPFLVAGCSTLKLSAASVESIPFWAMKYRVRSDESGLMILTYGWRYSTLVKESVEVYLSESDLERAYSVFQSTLENNLTGVASSWGNPMTVHSGTVTPSRTVFLKDQSPCRDFGIVVNVGGNEARGYGRYFKEIGTACRGDVGVWQVLQD